MKIKAAAICLICMTALLSSCNPGTPKKTEDTTQTKEALKVGDDKDEHGCISSAGYTWCEVQKDCIRLWEKGIRLHAINETNKTLFLVFSPDSTLVELFFSEEDHPNEVLERRKLPSGEYVWNIEDDDTKNVRFEKGHWRVSQRNKLIYTQPEK